MNKIFTYQGTFNGVTIVHSKAYGKHMRNKRGSNKQAVVNDAFQTTLSLNSRANPAAKAFKDAIDPYRAGFKDGSMWWRLLGLFQKSFRQNLALDFKVLENFQLYDKISLQTNYTVKHEITMNEFPEKTICIDVDTQMQLGLLKFKVDHYSQTLITIFMNDDLTTKTVSDNVMVPVKQKQDATPGEGRPTNTSESYKQYIQQRVPSNAKWAVIILKITPFQGETAIGRMRIQGMKILEVVNL